MLVVYSQDYLLTHNFKGITGPINLSGSTPDLGEFTIRIEDGTSDPTFDS